MNPSEAISYKARKEAFVSNLSGSSLTDINLVALVSSAAVLLWTALQKRQSFFTPYTPVSLVADFLLNVCAILFAVTLYSATPIVLSIFLITPALLLLFLTSAPSNLDSSSSLSSKKSNATKIASKSTNINISTDANPSPSTAKTLPVRPFLTHYRGSMLVVTCVSILAVDFPIFPRRFAKVETWGTSLMDLGVGLFVFSAGVVSARAIVKPSSSSSSFVSRFLISLRHALPLFILGIIRLLSVKNLDYAEHVTEYGVHWNFFFTLCLLPPFVEISDSLTRHVVRSYDLLAVLISVTYEFVLNSHPTLLRYILISERGPSWLSKNREGVFSFIGYLAIFLAGRGTGRQIVTFNTPPTSSGSSARAKPKSSQLMMMMTTTSVDDVRNERRVVLRTLAVRTLIYSALFIFTTNIYGGNLTVSRRLANLPYVLLVAAFNNGQLFLFGVVEDLGPEFIYANAAAADEDSSRGSSSRQRQSKAGGGEGGKARGVSFATSRILRVFNTNGLVIFLVANLLTGLVNLTVNTLDMAALPAMAVLILYAAVVTGVALGLDHAGIKIKI
ncbi:hypothetical protein PV08_03509 [Exophiala spinifera]|uniref:GPI-anchored wall transfer protein n=1 Tax=Exophiala spinifera TaxID=91928 RepID=A0A0D2BKT7_9EURO|nr:uncharacterized protein PV08_03509 [Exophiala spinifera]KIW19215.1 hypothetical protein PV08_03509 [Exophiala spinifera]